MGINLSFDRLYLAIEDFPQSTRHYCYCLAGTCDHKMNDVKKYISKHGKETYFSCKTCC